MGRTYVWELDGPHEDVSLDSSNVQDVEVAWAEEPEESAESASEPGTELLPPAAPVTLAPRRPPGNWGMPPGCRQVAPADQALAAKHKQRHSHQLRPSCKDPDVSGSLAWPGEADEGEAAHGAVGARAVDSRDSWSTTAQALPDGDGSSSCGACHAADPAGGRNDVAIVAASSTESTALGDACSDVACCGSCDLEGEPDIKDKERQVQEDEEMLMLLMSIEYSQSSAEILRCAVDNFDRLSPVLLASALHHAARHLPTDKREVHLLMQSAEFTRLMAQLRNFLPRIRNSRGLARLAWTLGKFETQTSDAVAAVTHLCHAVPPVIDKFSTQDLSNTLWGMARMKPFEKFERTDRKGRGAAAVLNLAQSIVHSLTERVDQLSAQCLSNSLWSVARLQLRGGNVEKFLELCVQEIETSRHLGVFTPQGLANIMWAVAELGSSGVGTGSHCRLATSQLCLAIVVDAGGRLQEFQPMELSMLAWSCAKVFGQRTPPEHTGPKRGRASRGVVGAGTTAGPLEEVKVFLRSLAEESQSRLPEFAPQGLSNIAWTLATLDLLGPQESSAPCRAFLIEAMAFSVQPEALANFAPQAVANLLWAAVRLHCPPSAWSETAAVARFASVVVVEAFRRFREFTWRDLSSITVALAYKSLRLPEVFAFLELVVSSAVVQFSELTPMMMLNIAQSSARLGLHPEKMRVLVQSIASAVAWRRVHLNEVDKRQWQEVQQWCPPSFVGLVQ